MVKETFAAPLPYASRVCRKGRKYRLLRRRFSALAYGDQAVALRLAVEREIEDVVLDLAATAQVALSNDQLVLQGRCHGDDLAGRRDDAGLTEQVAAFLAAGLGDGDHPGPVLVGTGLHHQVVMEALEIIALGRTEMKPVGPLARQLSFAIRRCGVIGRLNE